MRTKLAFALAVIGWLVAPPCFTVLAQAPDKEEEEVVAPRLPSAPLPGAGAIEFSHWHQGEPPVKLIRKEEGFCALTGMGGGFAGGAEEVHVYIGGDGYWYLGGNSRQQGVHAECVVVHLAMAPAPISAPTPDPAKHVKILAASFCCGSHAADVTARVKRLLHGVGTFQASPDWLLVDPMPYWKKALVIFYKVGGKRAVFTADEGQSISRKLLLEKARPVVGDTSLGDTPTVASSSDQ